MERFEGRIVVNEGGGAWVEVPGDVVGALGGGGRIPVRATFDGVAYRGSIASMGGRMALGVLKSSHRREHVNAINDAKKPETRTRRISKALEMLKAS
jgi:hypothetical protein